MIYGSSRLGTKDYLPGQMYSLTDYTQQQPVQDTATLQGRRPWYSDAYQDDIVYTHTDPWQATQTGMFSAAERIGEKQYELTNHLGNVMATVSDNKYGVYTGKGNVTFAGWHPALKAAYDYYPFGMLMPGRYVSDTSRHCVTVTQPHWAWKWVTIGCKDIYEWQWPKITFYGTATATVVGNSVALTAKNPGDGMSFEMEVTPNAESQVHLEINSLELAKNASIQVLGEKDGNWEVLGEAPIKDAEGVVLNITPKTNKIKVVLWVPIKVWIGRICVMGLQWVEEDQLVTICDGDGDKYRFGYNGQEKVNEWSGIGNYLDFKFRGYDSRIGRFNSIDPLSKKFPWWTPYQFAGNTPIMAKELEGGEILIPQLQVPIFMPRPVITLPRSGLISIPRVGMGEVTLPPLGLEIPGDITVGQPQIMAPGDAIQRIENSTGIDWTNNPPSSPENIGDDWEEVTDPRNKGNRREFQNKDTKWKIAFDPGEEGKPGWAGKNHWHRFNPFSKSKRDMYLDNEGNPVAKGSPRSHIEAPMRIMLPEVRIEYKKSWFEKRIKDPIRRWNDKRNQRKMEQQRKNYEEYMKRYTI